ncbi:hypothetical protein EBH_0061140 [Eimeria brunetti]|uniref:Uncharacterized protein n=1 Tax=Eimeria brunetti TaxID=51314 RepID=U6M1S8_9EIME|nr:hypothetical protein EBH_0061140 [Eimeria brunetti]
MGLGSAGNEQEANAAADAAIPALSPTIRDVSEHDGSLIISDDQESFVATHSKKSSIGSSALFRTVTVLLLAALAFGGFRLSAKKDKGMLGVVVPTDTEGMAKTLEDVQKAADRVAEEWRNSPRAVREAFVKFYSLGSADGESENKPFPSMVNNFVTKFEAITPPDDAASKSECIAYSLRNMLLGTIMRAAAIRLEQLNKLEKFTRQHTSCQVSLLNVEGVHLPFSDVDPKDGTTSFPEFTRDLQERGYEGIGRAGEGGPQVPKVMVDRLADFVYVRRTIEAADRAVLEEFQGFVASAERAKGGLEPEEKDNIDKIELDAKERPFPVPRFGRHVKRAAERMVHQHLTPFEVLSWRERWSPIGVQSLIFAQGSAQGDAIALEKDLKVAAVHGWNSSTHVLPVSQHLLGIAVGLL